MGFIPQSFIEELLARVDIVDVINARIPLPLKKTGRNYVACCPFHNEKTPSFNVVPDKQFYRCFGCEAAGSAIKFVMSYDQLDFKTAIEKLAAEIGLELPKETTNSDAQFNSRYQEYFEIMGKTAQHFEKNLAVANHAKLYLKKRGIDADYATFFQLGYAAEGWNNLSKYFNNYKPATGESIEKLLENVGLWLRKQEDNAGHQSNAHTGYDRFRNRMMFPIRDTRGRIIAFGGRVLDDSKPKYLNSPETVLFHKSSELYGLYETIKKSQQHKTKISRFVIVEGYLDVVALFQHGIDYAVATLGTATSYRHLAKLFKYSTDIIYCFDGDSAGRSAAWRALENSLSALYDGRVIKFLFLPDGHDPDSYVREFGKNNFENQLSNAISLTDFMFQHEESLLGDNSLATVEGRVNLVKRIKPLINKVPEGAYRTILETELARKCQLNIANLDKILTEGHDTPVNNFNPVQAAPQAIAQQARSDHATHQKPSIWRRACLLLIHNPNFIEVIKSNQGLTQRMTHQIYSTRGEQLFHLIYKLLCTTPSIPELLDKLSESELDAQRVILRLLDSDPMLNDAAALHEFEDLLLKINKEQEHLEMDILKAKITNQGMASLSTEEKSRLQSLLLNS